jgi:multidrug efflux pump subunit AcrA (membrane-fusion protein)
MGARVSFLQESEAGAPPRGVLVPGNTIVQRDGKAVAFEIEGDRVRRRELPPGQAYGEMQLIDGGLKPGARVVRNPPAELQDGMRVQVKPAA